MRELERAVADYTRAIDINPKYADAYHNRGIAYRAKGFAENADADTKKARQLDTK